MLSRSEPLWTGLGCASIAFHFWLVFSGLVPNLISRPLHMALALPWALVFAAKSRGDKISGAVLTGLGLFATCWIAWNAEALGDQYGVLEGWSQAVIAAILLAAVLEMARRVIGWPLPLMAALALCYGVWGRHIPGEFGHAGTPLVNFFGAFVVAEGGIWGQLTGVSVNVVAVFVILGAILNAGEAGRGFMNLAASAAGRLRGGAAKVAVISSALFGSISGSASANAASTGAVTIPAMLRAGYPRALAGSAEAVASSGGQIMPPLMGAGAFVMVELTGSPYEEVMAAALLPAILYFWAVWLGIDAFSLRHDLKGLPDDLRPSARSTLVTSAFFLAPFSTLLLGMFAAGRTPQYAACMAAAVAALMLPLDERLTFSWTRAFRRAKNACLAAGRQTATIASIILCASIIVGVLSLTGLGIKITSLILSISDGGLWPAILLTAIACLVLGMEAPTTAAYVICASVAAPALIRLGLEPLLAHLFVFWFALLSTITPPVCGTVFIAAGMAGANWLKVAACAMALGAGLYLIPLGMVAHPGVTALLSDPWTAIVAAVQIGAALAAVSFGIVAPFRFPARVALVAAGGGLLFLRLPA